MPLFNEQDAKAIREHLEASLRRPVQLALFMSEQNCSYCDSTHELLQGLSALHDRLSLTVYDLQIDAERAAALGVDKAPGIVILGGAEGQDYGIRFYGIPSGYEFVCLAPLSRPQTSQNKVD